MRKTLPLLMALAAGMTANAQDWFPVGNGLRMTSNNDVKVLLEYDGQLIAGGDMEVLHGTDTIIAIGRFDGTGWKQMGPGAGFNRQVNDLQIFDGTLYAGGDFFRNYNDLGVDFVNGLARWDGSAWQPVAGLGFGNVRALTIYDGKMCAARWEDENMDDQYTYRVSCYDGSAWTDLPGTFRGPTDYVELHDMVEYDGKLAVIGRFDSVADQAINMVALWDGSAWTDPGFPVTGRAEADNGNIIIFGYARTGEVVNGHLLVGGLFPDYGQGITIPFTLGSYDGTAWTVWDVDNVNQGGNTINDIVVMNDSVFVIGDFYREDPVTAQIWRGALLFDRDAEQPFTNLNFAPVLGPASGSDNVNTGYVWNGALYVGGDFLRAGSSEANNIARLDPNALQPTGIREAAALGTLNIHPNPATTSFTMDGLTAGSTITLMDAMGRTVSTTAVTAARMEVSVAALSTGIYMVQVMDGNYVRNARLVVN